jgi:purine-binding chemotaxis protein CheW
MPGRGVTSSVETETTTQLQLVSFRIGEEEFGVGILNVQEIIRVPTITPIPNAPEFIQGVINLRGRIIPVIDLRKRLKIHEKDQNVLDKNARILIVEFDSYITGFIVDAVMEVMRVAHEDVEPTPHLVASTIGAEYIKGVIKLPSRLIILLDFQTILNPEEEKQLEGMMGSTGETGEPRTVESARY